MCRSVRNIAQCECQSNMVTTEEERRFLVECIRLYRDLPALWDVTCDSYSDRAKKGEQYEELLAKYRERHPGADRAQLVRKINCLRTNFRKELKRVRDSGGRAQPTLWYFQEMRFVEGFERSCGSKRGNGEEEVTEDAKESGGPRKKAKKAAAVVSGDDDDPSMVTSPPPERHGESEFQRIAQTWAADLEKMEPSQQLFAKKFVSDILFEGRMGTLRRDSVQINSSRAFLPDSGSSSSSSGDGQRLSSMPHPYYFLQHLTSSATAQFLSQCK